MTLRSVQFAMVLCLACLVAGCSNFIERPMRPDLFDLGQSAERAGTSAGAMAEPVLVLPEIEAAGSLEGTGVLYRLVYADAQQLRAYGQSRWSAPAPQLVRRTLAERLARDRVVLNPGEAALLSRSGATPAQVLRLELQEFAQVFDSPRQSSARLRLRATLFEVSARGEEVLAQRVFELSRAAATADAAGGVQALAAAVQGAADDIAQWAREIRRP
ncbi:MAG TPA: ABC-type transport auxiliary lipoprotein family protein [Ramlibacter sp.]|nr:ABC-type transport auxiliary lipoprotein family protein [Ramlibacter sp.]